MRETTRIADSIVGAAAANEIPVDHEVQASHDAHTPVHDGTANPRRLFKKARSAFLSRFPPDTMDEFLAQVESEMFGVGYRENKGPMYLKYDIHEVDPATLVLWQNQKLDGLLLSGLIKSLDAYGIIIPPVAMKNKNGQLVILPNQGRIRVLWARDRGVTPIRVVVLESADVPVWVILREVAIEDVRKRHSYMQLIECINYFMPYITGIHGSVGARRKLLADERRSRTMLVRKSGKPTDMHKTPVGEGETWQKRRCPDPLEQPQSKDRALAASDRFKLPRTVSLWFRGAISEATAFRALQMREALDSEDPAIANLDLRSRLAAMAEGDFAPSGIERQLRSVKRVTILKTKIQNHFRLDEEDTAVAIEWIFKRIRRTNIWCWPQVNRAFGVLRRLLHDQPRRRHCERNSKEMQESTYGQYPGADVPLNLMTYLTGPGDLVVDFFAGSGATKDAAEHFLDPRWRHENYWIWWDHWQNRFSDDRRAWKSKGLDLTETVFPPGYWDVDHRRQCLQFDLEPNPLALQHYGPEFILHHDVCSGITDAVAEQVYARAPAGAQLVYLDPPYLSQADYANDTAGSFSNLCRMSFPRYIEVMSELLVQTVKILAPGGRIALLMGTDARQGIIIDPAVEIFRAIQEPYDRNDQIPVQLDRTGPLYHQVSVPCYGYGLGPQIAHKRSLGQLANVFRNLWILTRREKGNNDPLV